MVKLNNPYGKSKPNGVSEGEGLSIAWQSFNAVPEGDSRVILSWLSYVWIDITFTEQAPSETIRSTDVPGTTEVPAAGFELITFPAAMVSLHAVDIVPTDSPAPVIAASAEA
jgi:hypothetical protein